MPSPVIVRFAVGGMEAVDAAFASLASRSRKMNEQVANDTKKSAAKRVQSVRQGVDQELKAVEQWVAKSKALEDRRTADDQKQQAKRTQIAEKESTRRNKIQENSAKMAGRFAAQQAREEEKQQQAITRVHERESKKRQAAEQKAIASSANRARSIVQPFGRAARSTIGTVSGVVGGLGAASASMMIGASLMDSMALREQAALLVNSTRNKQGDATQTVAGLTGEAQSIAGKYGVGAGDVMKGMNVVAARAGGGEGLSAYRQDMEDITKTAVAFGVSMEDMGGVVAAALKAGVKPGSEMRDLIQDIAAMGKDGAIEIKDLASELAKLGGAGKMTNLAAGTMLRRQVGMAQVAADAAVSPEESRTSIVDLMRDINTNAGSLKAAGINVYDKQGMMNDPAAILAQTMDVAMTKGIGVRGRGQVKGSEALGKLFTGTSHKMVESLMADYNRGGAKGVMARIDASSGAKLAPGERDAGLALKLQDPATQLRAAMETLKADISTTLLPALVKLAPTLSDLTRKFAQLISWASQNPFTALTAIFGGYLAKELAAVGMSKMFQAGIQELLGAGGGGGGVGGKGKGFWGSGVGGNAAAFGAIALTAAAVYLTATKLIDENDEAQKRKGRGVYKTREEAENALETSKRGDRSARLKALTEADAALATLPKLNVNKETSLPQYLWKKYQNAAENEGAAGSRPTEAIREDITRAKEDIYKEADMAEVMKGFAILGPAVVKAAAELDKIKGSQLPNQSGAPTSVTPTSPYMK